MLQSVVLIACVGAGLAVHAQAPPNATPNATPTPTAEPNRAAPTTAGDNSGTGDDANDLVRGRQGVLVELTLPVTDRTVTTIQRTLQTITRSRAVSDSAERTTVVLRYLTGESDGSQSTFEDALKLARLLAKPEFRSLRIAAYLDGSVRGHAVLPIIASDVVVVGPGAALSEAAVAEPEGKADATIAVAYQAIAERRGLFPPPVVGALLDAGQELVLATTLDGQRRFVSGEELVQLRRAGGGLREDVWAAADQPLILDAERLQQSRMAAFRVAKFEEVAAALDLSQLSPIAEALIGDDTKAGLLEISGAISPDRVRRWELNLAKSADAGELNTVLISLDSAGGNLDASLRLAGTLSSNLPPMQSSIGFIQRQSRGDAALVALACKPLYMSSDAMLGGPGGQSIDQRRLENFGEAIEHIARDTGRPVALLRGLLVPELKVYRYTNIRTGQIRYATEDELALGSAEPEEERRLWRRGDLIELGNGLNPVQAIELGLAEGQANSLGEVALAAGLEQVPAPITDRGLVHFVEWIGGMKGVSIFLLMVGMVALSMEAGAPGLSIPGFVSLLCFSTYFWIQFLNGTAQWLEVLAFVLGIVCIAIEIFLLPGAGVFGIGGLCLLVLGVVLTSQTFVIPRNVYQFEQMTNNLWLVVGGFAAMVGGFVLLRLLVPQRMLFKHLALETPDDEVIDRAERLADFEHLLGASGSATTPLRPAGKARFGNEIVQVISDGTPINLGETVRVIEVRGNRVVVAPE